jgi:hypothetical protein
MTWRILNESLSGFRYFKTIEISYYFPSGTQKLNHPNPGIYFLNKSSKSEGAHSSYFNH